MTEDMWAGTQETWVALCPTEGSVVGQSQIQSVGPTDGFQHRQIYPQVGLLCAAPVRRIPLSVLL